MSKVLITRSKLDGLATTISAKSGATLPLTIAQMDAAVDGIEIGVDTSQDTVDAAHLLDGYTAHDSTGSAITGSYTPPTFATQDKSATPTTSQQVISPDAGYDGLSSVTVGAMPTGTAGTPTATKGTVSSHAVAVTPSVTNATGYITGGTKTGTAVSVTASELVSGTYTVTGSGTHDVTDYASASVAAATPTNDSDSEYITSSGVRKWRYRPKTIVPTAGWAAQRSASNPINGFWQTFDAIPTGTTVTPTTSAQTIGGADTMLEGAVTVSAVPVGTEGTPSAAKSVSGHTATVTPSVTNTAGLIGGGTHTGTAVTVAASELVSGTKSISANGTGIDVREYAAVDVVVPSSAPTLQAKTNIAPTTSSQTITADAGYDGLSSVQIDAMPSGVVVPASSISTSGGAAITTETGKIVLTKTVSNVPQVTTAGYVTSGTFGNTSVTLRADCSINDSSSLTQSGNTVTAPAGYYPIAATLTVSGGGSVKTATGTFTGNGTRTIDVACTFEPDIVYFTSNPGTTASSGTVAAIIVRDMMTATRYRNNATTNSHYAIPDIAGLNSNGSSYSWRATYNSTTSKVTLYCYSNNARSLLTNGRTYSYTFIKWT